MCGAEIERSIEVGLTSVGSGVRGSVISNSMSESVRVSCVRSPRCAALISLVYENQAGW